MIESEKIDEYYTRVVNLINEMWSHGDTIYSQQVVGKILISLIENYDYIVIITEDKKDLPKLSIKELVGSLRSYEKQRFFVKINPKRRLSAKTKWEFKNFSKDQQKKNYNPKKKKDHDDSSKKVEEKVEKSTSPFCKIWKWTNHNAIK